VKEEEVMPRRYVDCRETPSQMNCSVAIAADNDDELLEAVVQHAVKVHGHEDTPDFRKELRRHFKTGTPPERKTS